MPTLPILGPVDLWAPDPSVASTENVIEVLPRRYRTSGQVLAAMAGGLAAHMAAHDEAAEYAAAQSDILRATERYLDGLADDRGQIRGPNETDEQFRTRVIGWRDVATRDAVTKSLTDTLAPIVGGEPVLIDLALDGWYVDNGASTWSSHVWTEAGGGAQNYPDQAYQSRTNTNILDAIPLNDSATGRCFGVLVPQIDQTVGELLWVGGPSSTDCYVETGSATVEMAFTSSYSLSPDEAYQAIANSIESVRAHGVRWFLLDDSRL